MSPLDRRTFIVAGAAAVPGVPALTALSALAAGPQQQAPAPRRPMVISSGNGLPAVSAAMAALRGGAAPVEAVVEGVTLVEDDPNDMSVGLGGLPNEDGVVQLDASAMDGPSHKAGAVAALENVRNPAKVALQVLRRTDHALLVGAGALRFARAMGFKEENLLTDAAREAWLKWRANLNKNDDWLDDDQVIGRQRPLPQAQAGGGSESPLTWGTIHCAAVDERGDLGAVTSTSGLSFKLPGRVGDSPIVGAGMFVDNAVGAAGATGRGEAVIESCGAFQVVRHMADGLDPTEACLAVLKWIVDHTRRPDLLDQSGRPAFDVTLYALRKDGAYGSACMRPGAGTFAVHDGSEARKIKSRPLFA